MPKYRINYKVSQLKHSTGTVEMSGINEEEAVATATRYIKQKYNQDYVNIEILQVNEVKHKFLFKYRLTDDIPIHASSYDEALEILNSCFKSKEDLEVISCFQHVEE